MWHTQIYVRTVFLLSIPRKLTQHKICAKKVGQILFLYFPIKLTWNDCWQQIQMTGWNSNEYIEKLHFRSNPKQSVTVKWGGFLFLFFLQWWMLFQCNSTVKPFIYLCIPFPNHTIMQKYCQQNTSLTWKWWFHIVVPYRWFHHYPTDQESFDICLSIRDRQNFFSCSHYTDA